MSPDCAWCVVKRPDNVAPAIVTLVTGCVHEHQRSNAFCVWCLATTQGMIAKQNLICLDCKEVDNHDCTVYILTEQRLDRADSI